jgi:hypothetical protein
MLFKEITAVYYADNTKHIYAIFVQNAELFNVEVGGTYSYHCTVKD